LLLAMRIWRGFRDVRTIGKLRVLFDHVQHRPCRVFDWQCYDISQDPGFMRLRKLDDLVEGGEGLEMLRRER